jgi:hypothetical protein
MPKLNDGAGWKEQDEDWNEDEALDDAADSEPKEHITWEKDGGGLVITFPEGKTAYLQGEEANDLEDQLNTAEDKFKPTPTFPTVEDVWDAMLDGYSDVAEDAEDKEESAPSVYDEDKRDRIDGLGERVKAETFKEFLSESKKKKDDKKDKKNGKKCFGKDKSKKFSFDKKPKQKKDK